MDGGNRGRKRRRGEQWSVGKERRLQGTTREATEFSREAGFFFSLSSKSDDKWVRSRYLAEGFFFRFEFYDRKTQKRHGFVGERLEISTFTIFGQIEGVRRFLRIRPKNYRTIRLHGTLVLCLNMTF